MLLAGYRCSCECWLQATAARVNCLLLATAARVHAGCRLLLLVCMLVAGYRCSCDCWLQATAARVTVTSWWATATSCASSIPASAARIAATSTRTASLRHPTTRASAWPATAVTATAVNRVRCWFCTVWCVCVATCRFADDCIMYADFSFAGILITDIRLNCITPKITFDTLLFCHVRHCNDAID